MGGGYSTLLVYYTCILYSTCTDHVILGVYGICTCAHMVKHESIRLWAPDPCIVYRYCELLLLYFRGYREKGLHKLLHKSKDNICKTLNPDLLVQPPVLAAHLSQGTGHQMKEDITEDKGDHPEAEPSHTEEEDIKMEEDEEVNIDGDDSPCAPTAFDNKDSLSVASQDTPTDTPPTVGTNSSVIIDTESSAPAYHLSPPIDGVRVYDPFFTKEQYRLAHSLMAYINGMENRLFDAHLQIKVQSLYSSHLYHTLHNREWRNAKNQ